MSNASVARWGNSLAVRLPRGLATQLQLQEGSALDLTVRGGALVLTPAPKRPTLDELLAAGPSVPEHEVDFGAPSGAEVW